MELACHFMREVFRSHGACDFTEIALNSLEALTQDGEHNELSLQLDSQIKHILFDEYQDTSSSQLELLERLTANWQRVDNDPGAEHEGRTVFIVGDPMQSIYRFRAAEVGIFMRTRDKGLTTIKPICEELKCNFRSNKLLIGSFNTLFGGNQNDYEKWQASGDGIFPAKDGLNESAITYKLADTPTGDFKNPDKRTAAVSDPALVPIYEHVVPHPAGKDSNELEAEKVLELVQEFYRHLAESANKSDSEDPVEPQDSTKKAKEKIPTIAILLRSRAGANAIISKLRQNNIPYQAHDIELLSSSAAVNDLTVLTRALLHLGDDIAWLALLRSPLLGLNDKEITCLLEADAQRPNADGNNGSTTRRTATIWKILNRVDFSQPTWKDLDTDDLKTRCDHFRDAMRQALQMRGVQPLCSWVRGTWLSLEGPRTLTAIQEQGLVREYFAMLQELEGDDLPDAEEIQRRIAKHYAVPNTYAEGKNPVQIMTIHGAKGLEFDTVIIPFLNRQSNTGDNGLVHCHYMYGEANDANPATVFYCPSAPKEKEKDQNIPSLLVKKINAECELNERRRLLYVATTRAKSVLHFITIELANNKKTPEPTSMLNLLQEQLNEVKNPNTQQDNADKSPNQEDPSRNLPDNMPSVARLKLDILTGWKVEPGLQPEVRPNHEYDDKSAYGIALHLLCQYIGERNEDLQDNVEAYSDFIALGVAEYSKNNPDGKPDDLARLPHKLETGLQGLLSDPYGRWSLEHHTDSHCEQDVCIIEEGLAKEYRLDRIFTYAGQYWIVDYKTGDPSNADHYHEKMKLYAKLIATTKNIQTINLALVYVDSDNPGVQLFCAQYDSRTDQAIWDNKFMPKL